MGLRKPKARLAQLFTYENIVYYALRASYKLDVTVVWGLGFKRRGGSTFCPATIALYSAALLVAFVVFDRYASV